MKYCFVSACLLLVLTGCSAFKQPNAPVETVGNTQGKGPYQPRERAGSEASAVAPAAQQPSAAGETSATPAAPESIAPLPRPFPDNPPVGQSCRVHFRRDALGLSAPAPLGVDQGGLASRTTQMSGTLDRVTDQWLVIRSSDHTWWVPRTAILAIELTD